MRAPLRAPPQMLAKRGKLPDVVVACVGGGSNAIGMFHPFINDASVRLVGVEAAGDGTGTPAARHLHSCMEADAKRGAAHAAGISTGHHSATLSAGVPGVLHGTRTYLLQDKAGQITETHSISAVTRKICDKMRWAAVRGADASVGTGIATGTEW